MKRNTSGEGDPLDRAQIGLDRGRKAEAERIGGDRVADADLGELGDRLAERRQIVEVEVVAGVDAKACSARLGATSLAPEHGAASPAAKAGA